MRAPILSTFVCVLVLLLCVATSLSAAPVATLTGVSGQVQWRPSGAVSYASASARQKLEEGAWIRTGRTGWVEITLLDNSKLTLANDTELEISRYLVDNSRREGVLNLAEGKLRAAVVKLSGRQSDIKVRSKTAVAGVKGTEFLFLNRGPANVLFGTEGSVAVTGQGDAAKPLTADTVVQTTRGMNPTEPVKLEPNSPLALAKAAFDGLTGGQPPAEWSAADELPRIIARWNINYGHYLADAGKYEEALQVFQLALDLTDTPEIRADALLERGTVYGRFLHNPEAALAEYLLVLEVFPRMPQLETALFMVGQVQYEMGLKDQARTRFEQYLQQYPEGRYRSTVKTLLDLAGK